MWVLSDNLVNCCWWQTNHEPPMKFLRSFQQQKIQLNFSLQSRPGEERANDFPLKIQRKDLRQIGPCRTNCLAKTVPGYILQSVQKTGPFSYICLRQKVLVKFIWKTYIYVQKLMFTYMFLAGEQFSEDRQHKQPGLRQATTIKKHLLAPSVNCVLSSSTKIRKRCLKEMSPHAYVHGSLARWS